MGFLEHDQEGCRGCRCRRGRAKIRFAEGGLHPWACSQAPANHSLDTGVCARLFRACARVTDDGRGAVKIQMSSLYANAAWGERGGGNVSRGLSVPPAAPSFPAKCSRRTDSQACPWREGLRPPREPAPPTALTHTLPSQAWGSVATSMSGKQS